MPRLLKGCLIGFIFAEPLRYRMLDTHGPRLDHLRHGAVAIAGRQSFKAPTQPCVAIRAAQRWWLASTRALASSRLAVAYEPAHQCSLAGNLPQYYGFGMHRSIMLNLRAGR